MKHSFVITQKSFFKSTKTISCIDGTYLRVCDITRWCQDNLKTWNGFWNYQQEYVVVIDNIEGVIAFKLKWT